MGEMKSRIIHATAILCPTCGALQTHLKPTKGASTKVDAYGRRHQYGWRCDQCQQVVHIIYDIPQIDEK